MIDEKFVACWKQPAILSIGRGQDYYVAMEASLKLKVCRFTVILLLLLMNFHKIMMTIEDCVEDLKPILEKSLNMGFVSLPFQRLQNGINGLQVTSTFGSRFQRLNLEELTRDDTHYGFDESDGLLWFDRMDAHHCIYGEIYDISKQYLPMNAQPRASLTFYRR